MYFVLAHGIRQSQCGSTLGNRLIAPYFSLSVSFRLPNRQVQPCIDRGTFACPSGACVLCIFFLCKSQQADRSCQYQSGNAHSCPTSWLSGLSCQFARSEQLPLCAKGDLKDREVACRLQMPASFHLP